MCMPCCVMVQLEGTRSLLHCNQMAAAGDERTDPEFFSVGQKLTVCPMLMKACWKQPAYAPEVTILCAVMVQPEDARSLLHRNQMTDAGEKRTDPESLSVGQKLMVCPMDKV